MKTIAIIGTAIVAGAVRYASEGPIPVRDDAEADRLVEQGQAEIVEEDDGDEDSEEGDGLDRLKLDELRTIAADENVDIGDSRTKAEFASVIRAHRLAAGA